MTRHESRELAFILVFEKGFLDELTIGEIIENGLESEFFEQNTFAEKLAKKVFEHLEEIDSAISENLVGWSAKRISKVSSAIMRVAICEMFFSDDVPVSVAINEAVEIAKKYSTKEDASYINGVLGSVAKKAEK